MDRRTMTAQVMYCTEGFAAQKDCHEVRAQPVSVAAGFATGGYLPIGREWHVAAPNETTRCGHRALRKTFSHVLLLD